MQFFEVKPGQVFQIGGQDVVIAVAEQGTIRGMVSTEIDENRENLREFAERYRSYWLHENEQSLL